LRGENDKAFSPVFFSPFWLNKLDKLSKNSTEDIFHFGIPATLKKGNDGKVWVEGIASTDDKDLQGEKINKDAFILDYFLTKGYFNSNHLKETSAKVGVPTEAKVTNKGLYVKGYMLDTEEGRKIIELASALKKAGSDRRIGFSVEGKVIERDRKNPDIITKCWLKDCAITAEPINLFVSSEDGDVVSDVYKSASEALTDEDDVDGDNEGEKDDPNESEIDAEDIKKEGSTKPVRQKDVEIADANRTAVEALNNDDPKEDMDKFINDVPVAPKPKAAKSFFEDDENSIRKGFVLINSLGGEREIGDKKVPIHSSTYRHKNSGHEITVTGKEGAFAVVHGVKDDKGKNENIGMHVFIDDPKTGAKASQSVDEHLKGFGIKHKFADKKKLLGKSFIVAQDSETSCDVCNLNIRKGNAFSVFEGKCYCDDDCLEKALVTGYQFGATDQVDGAALRVEDLEGELNDLSFAPELQVKNVRFDTARANGGKTEVTLRDALNFLNHRGIPDDMAHRILVLMIKNDGKLKG
jgi:hypothetical protein